jgi:hypothetical protein
LLGVRSYIGAPRERGTIMAEYKQGWYDISQSDHPASST